MKTFLPPSSVVTTWIVLRSLREAVVAGVVVLVCRAPTARRDEQRRSASEPRDAARGSRGAIRRAHRSPPRSRPAVRDVTLSYAARFRTTRAAPRTGDPMNRESDARRRPAPERCGREPDRARARARARRHRVGQADRRPPGAGRARRLRRHRGARRRGARATRSAAAGRGGIAELDLRGGGRRARAQPDRAARAARSTISASATRELERAFPADDARACCARRPRVGAARDRPRTASQTRGRNDWPLDETARAGARRRCASSPSRRSRPQPSASTATTSSCPSRSSAKMAELGYFGLVDARSSTAAHEMGNLAMILTTEELSRASLAAAGSLITRPEILTKALLAGRHRGAEAALAAEDRRGRDHGRHLGDRARHRQRRRRREVPRRARAAAATAG